MQYVINRIFIWPLLIQLTLLTAQVTSDVPDGRVVKMTMSQGHEMYCSWTTGHWFEARWVELQMHIILPEYKINIKVYVYIVWYPHEFSIHNLHPWYWNCLSHKSHLLWEKFSIWALCYSYSQSLKFVPPGTHHCWVDRGGMIGDVCPTPLHMAGSVTQTAVSDWQSSIQVLIGLGIELSRTWTKYIIINIDLLHICDVGCYHWSNWEAWC